MKIRFLHSPFCKWSGPIRMAAAVLMLYGFIRIFSTADPAGIVISVAGALLWQAGMFFESQSPEFQHLQNISVESLMKAHPVSVNSEWTVAQTRTHLGAINSKSFFVTHQDGYLSGIVLPEWLDEIPDKKIRYVPMSTVARPISWVNAVRKSDTALTALKHMDLLRSNYLAVTDLNENLVGVITRENIASVIDGDQSAAWLCTSVRKPHEEIEY